MFASKFVFVVCFSWVLAVANAALFRKLSEQAKYLVSKLPGLTENFEENEIPLMFAGQLELYKENDTHLFFWKYSDNNVLPEFKKRTIFWLNGGPGCSSMDGALMEAGPFRINSDRKVIKNPASWHEAGDIVFVDQPAGTGFSYSNEYDHELFEVQYQFLKFMEKYFELFPEDEDNEIIFAGESYAGQYIPYIAEGILRRNKHLKEGQKPYKLQGLLIGNGWIAPDSQGLSYLPFAMAAGIIDNTHPGWNRVIRQHEQCQNAVNSMQGNSLSDYAIVDQACEAILTMILSETSDSDAAPDQQCYNMYDYTLKDSYPSCGMNWPPDLVDVGPFLNTPEVQRDLNLILNKKWRECSGRVGGRFTAKRSLPSVTILPKILEEIPIVLFNGNRDIICNYIGTEGFIKNMKWNGLTGFQEEEAYDWIYDNTVAGYIKSERNLTFVNVFDSSHMVPFDKPEVSRSLLDILSGNYDIKTIEEKKSVVTYPLGVRKIEEPKPEPATSTKATSTAVSTTSTATKTWNTHVVGSFTQFASGTSSDGSSPSNNPEPSESLNKITRVIQLIVLVIIVWGVYVLYSAYKSRPSSIIKTGPSGKKKNVQWADQLRQLNEEEEEDIKEPGFLSKAFNKFRRADTRGAYAPASGEEYAEDIELGENIREGHVDQFIIDSDDENGPKPSN